MLNWKGAVCKVEGIAAAQQMKRKGEIRQTKLRGEEKKNASKLW